MSSPLVLDTNLLVSFYNDGEFEESLLLWATQSDIFVSAVTFNEFVRGAHDRISHNIVKEFLDLMEGQVLTPTEGQWIECGHLSEQLLKHRKRSRLDVLLLQNDILIALGARDIGAKVVTSDKDFVFLRDWIKVFVEKV